MTKAHEAGKYVNCSSCLKVITEGKKMKFYHCTICNYDCCFTCKPSMAHDIVRHYDKYIPEEEEDIELFHDDHDHNHIASDRLEEIEIFGNHEKQDPNAITNNNEFMKKIAYKDDMHVDNAELHKYEDSN